MVKISLWDWLAYIAFAILVTYFLLKILGVIQSPIEFDIVVLVSGAYLIGRYAMKIDFISDKIEEHSNELKDIKTNRIYCNK